MKAVAAAMTAMAARMLIQDGRRMLYLNLRSGAGSFECISSSQILNVTFGTPPPGSGAYQHFLSAWVTVYRSNPTDDADISTQGDN